MRQLCAQTDDPQSVIYHSIKELWFEFDADHYQQSTPDLFMVGEMNAGHTNVTPAYIQELHSILRGNDKFVGAKLLQSCISALPDQGSVALGFMLARSQKGVRLALHVPGQLAGIYPYLEQIGWPGSGQDLAVQTPWLENYAQHFVLQIDCWPLDC